jgi:hypothetical protein
VPTLSLFLSGQQAPHRSGEYPETAGLYSGVTHHTRHPLLQFRPHRSAAIGQKVRSTFTSTRSVTRQVVAGLFRVKLSDRLIPPMRPFLKIILSINKLTKIIHNSSL